MTVQRPDWLRSNTRVEERVSPLVWRVTYQGRQIVIEDPPARLRLVVRVPAKTNPQIAGRDLPGGVVLDLDFEQRFRTLVSASGAFSEIRVSGPVNGRLDFTDVGSVVLPASNWQLRRIAPGEAVPDVEVSDGEGPTSIRDAEIGSILCHSPGRLTIDSRLTGSSRTVISRGTVVFKGPLAAGARVAAPEVRLMQPVRSVTIDAETAHLAQNVTGSPDRPARVTAHRATFKGDVSDAVVCTSDSIEIGGTATDSRLAATRRVSVAREVTNCDLDVLDPDDDAAVVVGGSDAQAGDPVAWDADELPDQPPWSPAEDRGVLAGSRVTVRGRGLVAIGHSRGSSILTDGGRVLAARRLDAGPNDVVRAAHVVATEIHLDGAELDGIESLTALGDVELRGDYGIAGPVIVRGRIEGPPPAAGDDLEDADPARRASVGCARLRVDGASDRIRLAVSDAIDLRGPAGPDARLRLGAGGTVVSDGATAELSDTADGRLRVSGTVAATTVTDGATWTIALAQGSSLRDATVHGDLRVAHWESRPRTDVRLRDSEAIVVLHPSAREDGEPQPCNLSVSVGGTFRLIEPTDGSDSPAAVAELLSVTCVGDNSDAGPDATIRSLSVGTERENAYQVALRVAAREGEQPDVELHGPVVATLTGVVRRLRCDSEGPAARPEPVLHLHTEGTEVLDASGPLRLGSSVLGRLHGPPPAERDHRTLELRGVDEQSGQSQRGRVIDVDPTWVPYEEVENLRGVGVIDPTRESLRRFATRPAKGRDEDARRADLRSRAEWATRLLDVMDRRAVAGSTRAHAKWAVAKLHHRSLPAGWERRVRWAHWAVGYSQLPLPALATWLFAVVLMAVVRISTWAIDGSFNPGRAWQAFESALLMPFAIVRLRETGGEALFGWELGNTLAYALLAVTFLFAIIAARNYLRTPGE